MDAKNTPLKVLFLLLSYAISLILIYMALTDTGIFRKRLESRMKSISEEVAEGFEKTLSRCKSLTEAIARDPNIKLIFLQSEIGGNRREYINYLSRLRSSITYVYKIVLLKNDGSFLVSSEYFENEFREFAVAKRYLNEKNFLFFGSFDVIYSIAKVYDQRGVEKGYFIIGWYKDLFKQPTVDPKNLKFVQNFILINFPEKLSKDITDNSTFIKKAIMSEKVKDYNLTILFFKPEIGPDFINILVVILSLLFAILVTVWFLVSTFSEKKVELAEEIRNEVFDGIEKSLERYHSELSYAREPNSETSGDLREITYEGEKYKYEEIESDIVPYTGSSLTERNISSVDEVFDYLLRKLGVKKVMFMNRAEDGFIQTHSIGFETTDFTVLFTDKVWEKFLSRGKAVSIKGDIKDLYELGGRLKDDLFEITIFPVFDFSGNAKHLFVTGRRWTENEPGIEVKKEVFSRIKYLTIHRQ